MKSFIGSLIQRSIENTKAIMPRTPGMFDVNPDFVNDFQPDKPQSSPVIDNSKIRSESDRQAIENTIPVSNTRTEGLIRPSVVSWDQSSEMEKIDPTGENITINKRPLFESLTPSQTKPDPPKAIESDDLLIERQLTRIVHTNPTLGKNEHQDKDNEPVRTIHRGHTNHIPLIRPSARSVEELPQGNNSIKLIPNYRMDAGSPQKIPGPIILADRQEERSPTINVSIGRIEVRVFQSPPDITQKSKSVSAPGIEEFLNEKNRKLK